MTKAGPKKLEYVRCNLCGSRNFTLYLKSPDTKLKGALFSTTSQAVSGERLVRCRVCGLIFVNPRLTERKIISSYEKGDESTYTLEAKARARTFRHSLRIIKKYKNKGKLLDVGCAAGFFLKEAQTAGFEVLGVEPNRNLSSWGFKNLGVRILGGSFEKFRFPAKSFDVISFWDTLEHFCDPLSALRKANSLLKREGIVVVNYPDINSHSARIFGKNWWFITSGHLFYFSETTLRRALSQAGFEVKESRPHTQLLSVAYLIHQIGRYNRKLAKHLYSIACFMGLERILVPYRAGQRMFIARKKAGHKN